MAESRLLAVRNAYRGRRDSGRDLGYTVYAIGLVA